MLITGLYDVVAKKFIQFIPTPTGELLKRDFKNAVKQERSIYNTNAEDFEVYVLAEVDESTGACTPCDKDLLFTLASLKDDPQVQ